MEIDKELALKLLHEVAVEYPDLVYKNTFSTCQYVVQPMDILPVQGNIPRGCIVGEALLLAGMEIDEVRELSGNVDSIAPEIDKLGFILTDDAQDLFSRAQIWQDQTKVTWTEAVKLAEAGYEYNLRDNDAASELIGREIEIA